MINYSIAMMGNPAKPDDPKKAYGVAQYTEKMTLEKFSEHISEHNNVLTLRMCKPSSARR